MISFESSKSLPMDDHPLQQLASRGLTTLEEADGELAALLVREQARQQNVLTMIAASSFADPSVLVCQASVLGNVTAEGYRGARYHGGAAVADEVETLAIARARQAFGARYANVQPHSGSSANESVLFGLLAPGDTILGLELAAGGHLTHGAPVSISGRLFRAVAYGLDGNGRIDLDELRRLAHAERPRLLFAGASSYPRAIDFAAFRRIADEVGAYLVADISHVAGLVCAGEHASPIDHAHVTTTSTYKQLFGPRGGLILMGRDHDAPGPDGTLAETIQRAVFPLTQGTPNFAAIAAKARALALVATDGFAALMRLVVADARRLAEQLVARGHRVCTGGTDNHLVLVETAACGVTGLAAERALEACDIIVNRNRVPGDRLPASVTGGIRLGTNTLAGRGMGPEEMNVCATLVDDVLGALRGSEVLDTAVRDRVRARVAALCARFPLPGHGASSATSLR